MVEKSLADKFSRIFHFKRVTFDQPGESLEQEVLFIEIESPISQSGDGEFRAMIKGTAKVYAPHERLPIGYLSRCIREAKHDDTKDFFFSAVDENRKILFNIVERSFAFTYFFNSQYNPAPGNIESVTISEVTE